MNKKITIVPPNYKRGKCCMSCISWVPSTDDDKVMICMKYNFIPIDSGVCDDWEYGF